MGSEGDDDFLGGSDFARFEWNTREENALAPELPFSVPFGAAGSMEPALQVYLYLHYSDGQLHAAGVFLSPFPCLSPLLGPFCHFAPTLDRPKFAYSFWR